MKLLSGILLISLMLPQARGEQASSINQCFNSREPAQCELKAGVQAYANARYQEAISHFTAALQFDPRLAKAHLYLATAYANQFIPGADTPENIQAGVQAIREFQTAAERREVTTEL
jgi:Tfp pilus assembly protein PilF